MSAKYHINYTTGEVGKCSATVRCPFGDSLEDHFDTAEEARERFERQNAAYTFTPKVQRGMERIASLASFDDKDYQLYAVRNGGDLACEALSENPNADSKALEYARDHCSDHRIVLRIEQHKNYPVMDLTPEAVNRFLAVPSLESRLVPVIRSNGHAKMMNYILHRARPSSLLIREFLTSGNPNISLEMKKQAFQRLNGAPVFSDEIRNPNFPGAELVPMMGASQKLETALKSEDPEALSAIAKTLEGADLTPDVKAYSNFDLAKAVFENPATPERVRQDMMRREPGFRSLAKLAALKKAGRLEKGQLLVATEVREKFDGPLTEVRHKLSLSALAERNMNERDVDMMVRHVWGESFPSARWDAVTGLYKGYRWGR